MSPPLPLAGEGRGEAEGGPLASGMTLDGIPLTVALRHPVLPDLCKEVRGSFLSPWGEEARIYFLSNYKQGRRLFTGAGDFGIKGEITGPETMLLIAEV